MQLKAFIPILNPLIISDDKKEKEFVKDTFHKMIQELSEDQEYTFLLGEKTTKAELKIKETDEAFINRHHLSPPFRIQYCLFITVHINIDKYINKELEEHLVKEYNYTQEQLLNTRINDVTHEFEKIINDFRIAVNIAFPGFFDIGAGYIFVDNKKYSYVKIESSYSFLLESVLEAQKRKWPEISILNIKKTWEWLLKRENFVKAMSSNAIERALSSFTYLFNSDNHEDLFYSLIGLEAIYTKGKQGISEQLREKSIALFGEPENYKSSLSKMYDIRSKFIHGSLNFPSKYYIYDGLEQFDKFETQEYIQCLKISEALLVATIQQFVIRDAETLDYSLTIQFK